MSDSIERLKTIRRDLEQRQRELDRLEGSREQLLKTLKEKFGLSTLAEAKAEADRREKELDELEKAIEKGVAELEQMMKGTAA